LHCVRRVLRSSVRSYRKSGTRYALRLLATEAREHLLICRCTFKFGKDKPLCVFSPVEISHEHTPGAKGRPKL